MRTTIWHSLWVKLRRSQRGSTSIIMAFAEIVLIGMGAVGIDIAGAVRTQNTLQNVLDTTALQVARRSVSDRSLTAAQLRQFGEETVREQVGDDVTFQRFDVDVSGVSVEIEATNIYQTHFALVLRKEWQELDIVSSASAVFELADIDFFMLLDNSPSMGLGATPSDNSRMRALTENLRRRRILSESCEFACHRPSSPKANSLPYIQSAGIQLRIDAVADAVDRLITEMEDRSDINRQFRMAAYTFGTRAADRTTRQIAPLSDNFSQLRANTANIPLVINDGNNNYVYAQHFGHSDFLLHLDDMRNNLQSSIAADGGQERTKVLFIVTDGVHISQYRGWNACTDGTRLTSGWQSCSAPVPVAYCDAIKDMGVTVAILYTEYIELPHSFRWRALVQGFTNKIEPNLEACASPGLFRKVDFGGDSIDQVIVELFEATIRKLQLV